jgi:hypothetical protein
MTGKPSLANRAVKSFTTFGLAMALCLSAFMLVGNGQGTAAQLLREGNSYQSADDTSDRAAIVYRLLIQQYPKSIQAEQAQFYLGTYYQKKFYILEYRNRIEDWSSFNQAEDALWGYVAKYSSKGTKFYLADTYHTLAMIKLRRGGDTYRADAKMLLKKMSDAADKDPRVYMYKVVWTPRKDDITKGYCDTRALAAANLDAIDRIYFFNDIVFDLRNWCRNNCR